jgi:hypothetical protein
VFSMDGDLCPLREIMELGDAMSAWYWWMRHMLRVYLAIAVQV